MTIKRYFLGTSSNYRLCLALRYSGSRCWSFRLLNLQKSTVRLWTRPLLVWRGKSWTVILMYSVPARKATRNIISISSGSNPGSEVPALDALSVVAPQGSVKFQPWQSRLSPGVALNTAVKQFQVWEQEGYYNPEQDIILCPYNVEFGTIELNKGIMQYLGAKRGAVVHEIIAGYQKHYYAIGDRVLYEKEDAVIVDIARNSDYLGQLPQKESVNLDRWGHRQKELTEAEQLAIKEETSALSAEQIESLLNTAVGENEDRVQAASHVVILKTLYGGEEVALDKASQFNGQNLLGGYAITVHKSQGSEYDRVFITLHSQHVKMVSRELLYGRYQSKETSAYYL
jgi:hypothetical protein